MRDVPHPRIAGKASQEMTDDPHARADNDAHAGISRRDLLRAGATGALSVGTVSLVAACGGSSGTASTASTASLAASKGGKRGGTLHAGLIGGSASDLLNPLNAVTTTDFARCIQLYDQLAILDPDASIGMKLAEEITPNANATEWTIRLRPGVTFHDGKPLTADDVVYTFQTILNPKTPTISTVPMAPLDRNKITKVDKLTVKLGCHHPFSTFLETAASLSTMGIIPVGFDPKKPVGTGPFMYKSFTPGQQSVFVRNPNYWEHGLPYLDRVVITDYADETSQVNALLAGQVDVIDQLSAASIATLGSSRTLVSRGGGFNPFTMRQDVAPFNDVRVRQALRFVVNRPEFNSQVFLSNGTVANDLWSPFDPLYDHSLPQRVGDVEKAKALLKAAGHEGLSVQLVTSPIAQGTVTSAQVFAQQASAAGVHVNLRQVTVTEFFGPSYLKWPFAQDYWFYLLYFPQVADSMIPGGLYDETHFSNPRYFSLYSQALATTDLTKRREIAHEMQNIDYNEGTYIIPIFVPCIDGHGAHVQGIHGSKTGQSLGNYDFKNMSLT